MPLTVKHEQPAEYRSHTQNQLPVRAGDHGSAIGSDAVTAETRSGFGGVELRVELRGFEPLTFSLRTRRATNCAIAPEIRPAAGSAPRLYHRQAVALCRKPLLSSPVSRLGTAAGSTSEAGSGASAVTGGCTGRGRGEGRPGQVDRADRSGSQRLRDVRRHGDRHRIPQHGGTAVLDETDGRFAYGLGLGGDPVEEHRRLVGAAGDVGVPAIEAAAHRQNADPGHQEEDDDQTAGQPRRPTTARGPRPRPRPWRSAPASRPSRTRRRRTAATRSSRRRSLIAARRVSGVDTS